MPTEPFMNGNRLVHPKTTNAPTCHISAKCRNGRGDQSRTKRHAVEFDGDMALQARVDLLEEARSGRQCGERFGCRPLCHFRSQLARAEIDRNNVGLLPEGIVNCPAHQSDLDMHAPGRKRRGGIERSRQIISDNGQHDRNPEICCYLYNYIKP
ncbi:hypothetical protein D9M72_498340 [compost metagenome]